jgi:pimeloyl-ACP methyl ester carboxylesterase
MESFVSRYFNNTAGLKIHFRDYAGPANAEMTVICLPGLTRGAKSFEDLAPHLATRYRVLCIEFRGRGQSEFAVDPMTYVPISYVEDLRDLYDHLGLAHAALIGTSLGGFVGTMFSAIFPGRVLGLILNDVGTEIDPRGLARIGSYVGKTTPITSWEDAAERIKDLDGAIFPEFTKPDWLRMARRRFVQNADGSFRPDYDLNISKSFSLPATTADLWPFYRRLQHTPMMVIRGATSDILARDTVDRMKESIPALRTVEVPNRGHAPNLDEPAALTAIDDFVHGLRRYPGFLNKTVRSLAAWQFFQERKRAGVF